MDSVHQILGYLHFHYMRLAIEKLGSITAHTHSAAAQQPQEIYSECVPCLSILLDTRVVFLGLG